MIRKLAEYQVGQRVRSDGPQTHLTKAGTPTMGGALILGRDRRGDAAVGRSRATASSGSCCCVTVAFGLIGFWDDYLKLVVGNSRGLIARYKYFWQSVAGLGAAIALYVTAQSPADTTLYVPFFKHVVVPLGVAVHPAHVFRDRRLEQRGEPDRRARRARDHAGRARRRRARRVRVCLGQRRVLELPRHPVHRRRGRSAGDLRGDLRRRSRLPLVQHVSRAGVHGRHRRARARRGARRHRGRRPAGNRAVRSWAACSSWRRCR